MMNDDLNRSLILGAGALAGGWGGAWATAKIGAVYGLRFGPVGTVAGAAIGALVGVGVCKWLMSQSGDLEGEFEIEEHKEAA